MKIIRAKVELADLIYLRKAVFIRGVAACFAALVSAVPVASETDSRAIADLIYEVGETRFELASVLLRSSADYVAENPNASAAEGHRVLKSILNDSKHVRAILAVDENGLLMFDSYNAVPIGATASTPSMDLSERYYFKGTTSRPAKELLIHPPVVGRQSGETFVPLTMAVPNKTGFRQSVIVLAVPPSTFIPPLEVCIYCGVVLVHNGNVLASNRPMSDINSDVIARLDFAGRYGASDFELRGMRVQVHWRKSEKTGVVFMYYEADPNFEG